VVNVKISDLCWVQAGWKAHHLHDCTVQLQNRIHVHDEVLMRGSMTSKSNADRHPQRSLMGLRLTDQPFIVRNRAGDLIPLPAKRQNCNRFSHAG